jgi:hypothetical protein
MTLSASRIAFRYLSTSDDRLVPAHRNGGRVAMEFDTQDALDAYLKEHPKADKAKHTIKKPGAGADAAHVHEPDASLGSKLHEHAKHVLFDDVEEAWTESKRAYQDIVQTVKAPSKHKSIMSDFRGAKKATKTFFSNNKYRQRKMKALGSAIRDGAKALGKRLMHAAQAEVHEVGVGLKAVRQVLTPGSPPLEKKQKKALYGLGAYVAGATLAATGAGVLMAGASLAKSFSLHVGIKAVSHLADSFFTHFEWGVEGSHIVHGVTDALSHVAATKDDAKADDALMEAMVLAVSKVLEKGMTDAEVKSMLSGEDVDAYDAVKDIPAIDKLKGKADKEDGAGKEDKADKADKEASLRGRAIRLAHARPDLRPHLLPLISGGKK